MLRSRYLKAICLVGGILTIPAIVARLMNVPPGVWVGVALVQGCGLAAFTLMLIPTAVLLIRDYRGGDRVETRSMTVASFVIAVSWVVAIVTDPALVIFRDG
jgi:predicted RND superfamily exporter protein